MIRFLLVGSLGFLVDAGVFYLLISLDGDAYLMRLISFVPAVSVTWWLNRNWTFSAMGARQSRNEYLSYVSVQAFGVCVNYAVYVAILSMITLTSANAILALACGSIAAMAVNFCGARYLVFPVKRA